jgi:hypothetical protein
MSMLLKKNKVRNLAKLFNMGNNNNYNFKGVANSLQANESLSNTATFMRELVKLKQSLEPTEHLSENDQYTHKKLEGLINYLVKKQANNTQKYINMSARSTNPFTLEKKRSELKKLEEKRSKAYFPYMYNKTHKTEVDRRTTLQKEINNLQSSKKGNSSTNNNNTNNEKSSEQLHSIQIPNTRGDLRALLNKERYKRGGPISQYNGIKRNTRLLGFGQNA